MNFCMKAVSLRPEKISVGIRDFQLYDIFVQFDSLYYFFV